jgi:hypothetical protein
MNSLVEKILEAENILLNDECVICYKKFINIKDKDYNEFYNQIRDKYKLPNQNIFEEETTCMCYDAKFECLICTNKVCCGCIMNIPDYENGKYIDKYNNKIEYHDMEYTGVITCPICRTKDYKLLYKYILEHIKHYKNSVF